MDIPTSSKRVLDGVPKDASAELLQARCEDLASELDRLRTSYNALINSGAARTIDKMATLSVAAYDALTDASPDIEFAKTCLKRLEALR